MYLGLIKLGSNLTFTCNTHTPSTGAAVAADAPPAVRCYEDETTAPILTATMAALDAANCTGFYSEQIAVTTANGFEAGKSYTVRITGVVGGVTGVEVHQFDVSAKLLDDLNDVTAGAQMDIVNAPNAAAIAAITLGLATSGSLATVDDMADAVLDEASAGHVGFLTTLATAVSVNGIPAAVMAAVIETGKTLQQNLQELWAVMCGNSAADSANDPTVVTYKAVDNITTRVTHALTDTTRTKS